MGRLTPDEDKAEEHGVSHGVGLVKHLVLQEAGLVEQDAHDKGHDELVKLEVRQAGEITMALYSWLQKGRPS